MDAHEFVDDLMFLSATTPSFFKDVCDSILCCMKINEN